MEDNEIRANVIDALYRYALLIGTTEIDNKAIVLFNGDEAGIRACSRAIELLKRYHNYEMPPEDIQHSVRGCVGFWMPSKLLSEGVLKNTEEFDYLEKRALQGGLAYIQKATDMDDLNTKLKTTLERMQQAHNRAN